MAAAQKHGKIDQHLRARGGVTSKGLATASSWLNGYGVSLLYAPSRFDSRMEMSIFVGPGIFSAVLKN